MNAYDIIVKPVITEQSMDSVADRDYLVEFISDLSLIMLHLSRFSEEFIIWNSIAPSSTMVMEPSSATVTSTKLSAA